MLKNLKEGTQLMLIYQPYFYVIQDIRNGMYYVGAKWGKNANPATLMIEGGYETSSKTIKKLIQQYGLDNFVVRKIRTFETVQDVHLYEKRFLQKVNAGKNPKFYNGHNNDGVLDPEKMRIVMMELYGVQHPMQSPVVREKSRKTSLKKYGTEFPCQSEIVKRKKDQTNLEKRGVRYPLQSEEVVNTMKKNNLEKYGVENTFQAEWAKEKIRQTNLEKRGVEYYSQSEDWRIKVKNTKKEKYGDENYSNADKMKRTKEERYGDPGYTNMEQRIATNRERYGGNAPASSQEVINKMKNTTKERYGAENYNQSEEGREVNVKVKKDKRKREVVTLILGKTTKKQRGKLGLGKGWYQRSDEYLLNIYDKIINQQ
jgi:hypothetical protein